MVIAVIVLGIICLILTGAVIGLVRLSKQLFSQLYDMTERYEDEKRRFQLMTFVCSDTSSGIGSFLKDKGYKKIVIYGVGNLFNIFKRELCENDEVEVVCFCDRNDRRSSIGGIPIIRPEGLKETDADAIIVTAIQKFGPIKRDIEKITDKEVVNLADMVYWM